MGDRAVITTRENLENNGIGIYLHWYGDIDHVTAFLRYCEMRGFRRPDVDSYGFARLVQVISNYIGGGLSIGVDVVSRLDTDNWDNGTYIIEGWRIVESRFSEPPDEDVVNSLIKEVDSRMPDEKSV